MVKLPMFHIIHQQFTIIQIQKNIFLNTFLVLQLKNNLRPNLLAFMRLLSMAPSS